MSDASQNGFEAAPNGWQALVNEVHARIDAVDSAMSNLRIAVRYLETNASRENVQTALAVHAEASNGASAQADAAAVAAAKEAADAKAAAEAEAAREEVRKAVEAAKSELNPYGFGSEVWTMPRDVWPGGPSSTPATPEPISTGDPTRDEVRRAVEEAKAQMASGELKQMNQPSLDELHRAAEHAAEQAKVEAPQEVAMPRDAWPSAVPAETPEPVVSEDPARDVVRRAVEEAKAQIARGDFEKPTLADIFQAVKHPEELTPAAVHDEEPSTPEAENDSVWEDALASMPAPSAADLVSGMPKSSWATMPVDAPASDWATTPVDAPSTDWTKSSTPADKPSTDWTKSSTHTDAPSTDWTKASSSPSDGASGWGAPSPSAWPSASSWATPEPVKAEDSRIETPEPVAEAAPSAELDAEAQRNAVREAVERAKAEMQAEQANNGGDDEEAAREEVRRAVAQMRGEIDWGGSPRVSFDRPGTNNAPVDDAEAKRDEVRRMVEAARAEVSFGGGLAMYDDTAPPEADGLKPDETRSLFAAFSGADNSSWIKEPDLSGLPASIVIEDPEGRVELARVYDTLNRVDRSTASLLNYTPHSVTVGLTPREPLPAPEVMVAAVRDAFGRGCKVTTEGVKMSVKIGEGEKAA